MERLSIIAKDIFPITFMLCSMVGATALILVAFKIPNLFQSDLSDIMITFIVIILASGLICLGLRKRTVRYNHDRKEIYLQWGNRWPITYRRFAANAWQQFSSHIEHPVGVTPIGPGTVRTTSLPPQWRLIGITVTGKKVNLGRIRTEAEANTWVKQLTSSLSP